MKTPVNSRTLRQHLTYSWWKYALIIVLGAFAVNMYFTTTAYRTPNEKKVDMYVYGYADETSFQAYLDRVRETEMPDMEELRMLLLTTDATYGAMQLSTYIAAAEGDVYLLPRDNFVSMASQGVWIPLEEDEELMSLFSEAGISLQGGWRRNADEGVSHLYGIPVSALAGLENTLYAENGYISLLVSGGNDANALKFLRILCRDMLAPRSVPESTSEPVSP